MTKPAGRSELDGERYPVKLPADVDDDRHIGIPQREFAEKVCSVLDEQLNGREVECLLSVETGQYSRNLQRLQATKALALDTERLAAGRQDSHTGTSPRHPESQSSSSLDDMLAVVEHQEHPFVAQQGEQAGEWILRGSIEAKCRTNGCRQQPWFADGGQIDKPNTVLETVGQPFSGRNGNAGLADTARSDKRD